MMRPLLFLIGFTACLILTVISIRPKELPPVVAISSSTPNSMTVDHPTTGSSVADANADFSAAESVPDDVRPLAIVLQRVHTLAVQTFDSAPGFGRERNWSRTDPPPPAHMEVPLNFPNPRILGVRGKQGRIDELWEWMYQMQGMTRDGLVYRVMPSPNQGIEQPTPSNFLYVSVMPQNETGRTFVERVISSTDLPIVEASKAVWRIDSIQLVSLLKHETPVAYCGFKVSGDSVGRHPLSGGDPPLMVPETRDLDSIEQNSLKSLQEGADCVLTWNSSDRRIQMMGSIRASQSCLKCHDVEAGFLLGSFSYQFKKVSLDTF